VRCSRSWAFEAMSSANDTDLYVLMGLPGTVLDWTPDGSGWSCLAPLRHPMWEGCGKPTGRVALGVGLGFFSGSIRAMICWSSSASWGRARTGHHVIDGAVKLDPKSSRHLPSRAP